jgi:hypothetical protein
MRDPPLIVPWPLRNNPFPFASPIAGLKHSSAPFLEAATTNFLVIDTKVNRCERFCDVLPAPQERVRYRYSSHVWGSPFVIWTEYMERVLRG